MPKKKKFTCGTCAALCLLLSAGTASVFGQGSLRRCKSGFAVSEQSLLTATERPSVAQSSSRRAWRYRITTLEPIDYASEASSINDTGLIGGASYVEVQPGVFAVRGTYWQNPKHPFMLQTPELFAHVVLDINELDEMVGITWQPAFHADFSRMSILPDYGIGKSYAWGINNYGEIVGLVVRRENLVTFRTRACLWRDGHLIELPLLPGTDYSAAFDINDDGVIVGESGDRAVAWADDQIIDLHACLDGDYFESEATAVNAKRQVTGRAYSPGLQHVVVWELTHRPYGHVEVTCSVIQAGSLLHVHDINDHGQIVGVVDSRAFLVELREDEEATTHDLNDLIPHKPAWVLRDAKAINNRGQIVGTGWPDGSTTATRGYLLRPIPGPAQRRPAPQ